MEAVASYSFTARAEDELSFEKDDILKILVLVSFWFKAELNGKEGYVPSNYIVMKPHPWYVPNITRQYAVYILLERGLNVTQPDGAFLVRDAEVSPGDFALSVRFGDTVQHQRILRDGSGKYFLWVVKFVSVNQLIKYHRTSPVSRTQTIYLKDMIKEWHVLCKNSNF